MQHIFIDGSLFSIGLQKDENTISHLLVHENVKPSKITSQYEYNMRFSGKIESDNKTIGSVDTTIYFIDAKAKKLGYIERVEKETNIEFADFPDYFVSIYEPLEKFSEYKDIIALNSQINLKAFGDINKKGKGIITSYTLNSSPLNHLLPIDIKNDESLHPSANNDLQNISQDTFGMRENLLGLRKDILIITIIQIILLLAVLVK